MTPDPTRRTAFALIAAAALGACAGRADRAATRGALYPNETPELRRLIEGAARRHDVPVDLVQRVVRAESTHNPAARNGPYLGLMQIHPATARGMGYTGSPEGLLDAATNLEYGVKYLRGAWIVARGNRDRAVSWYRRGYYYEARRLGLLRETGLSG
ncbi:MAG: transglycosylase SLT domain-containing protein [Gemmobacter sp.]